MDNPLMKVFFLILYTYPLGIYHGLVDLALVTGLPQMLNQASTGL